MANTTAKMIALLPSFPLPLFLRLWEVVFLYFYWKVSNHIVCVIRVFIGCTKISWTEQQPCWGNNQNKYLQRMIKNFTSRSDRACCCSSSPSDIFWTHCSSWSLRTWRMLSGSSDIPGGTSSTLKRKTTHKIVNHANDVTKSISTCSCSIPLNLYQKGCWTDGSQTLSHEPQANAWWQHASLNCIKKKGIKNSLSGFLNAPPCNDLP